MQQPAYKEQFSDQELHLLELYARKLIGGDEQVTAPRGFIRRGIFSFLRFGLRTGLRFEVHGTDRLPAKGGFLLCPNHQSHLDAFVTAMCLEPKRYFDSSVFDRSCCLLLLSAFLMMTFP